jgi:glucose 1-dehydrogenase
MKARYTDLACEAKGVPMRLNNKVAIVTGASSGIGQAIAVAFAREGAAVVVDYVGDASAAAETMRALDAMGAKSLAVAGDVSRPEDVRSLVQRAVTAFGRLDIIVNNAGIEKKCAFVDYALEDWQKIVAVNLTGTFLCAQAAARQMITQGDGGRIINISSIHEDIAFPLNAAYAATKGGIRMLMRTASVELAPHGITVNNIGPGAIYTPIDKDVQSDPKLEAQLMAEIPMARWGKPEEVAQLAVYLASEDAAYVTGSTHFIDGGMMRNAGSL